MRQQLIDNGCTVRIINGMPDHIHLLFLQNPKMAISDIFTIKKHIIQKKLLVKNTKSLL